MTATSTWSADAEENAAVEALYELMGTLAELLHACAEARYGDPTGGHRVG
ncbi:hypothetical protein [Nocardia wallacei]|uniref:Uncharacterized protein n=1 Tax=Nocardia wallacei TaxID=480035 RepID=A0A7G1KKU0_9NOCA|nr:hypothetical protein [Nocardia wallacei]BCK54589.1 hypothetical protein NWFMUON74_23610 [Nocardia wallacei]